ncbi:Glutamyl-tRNA reductase [Pseudoalteromonas sp. P1-9]|uniref:glutamyl-tRNA reductase n=1 Tax=Pseudoalteromonas sp. P1-9 TaxID=1710354 RepID=UPI0006D60D6C|nr:glutamyl-tRNA reductase [Pseudoalteromonas sp. P1-9]KPV97043.1 Glutamyl-tRNA reductase [Pseudoalteromonas sp. P1-9]
MTIVALGINHKTASVELRERVAFSPEQIDVALAKLCQQNGVNEAVVVSTCNRTELYCIVENQQPQVLIDWLADFHQLNKSELAEHVYQHQDFNAIQHLMRVSVGLDSLVLGEPQILGQIKQAYAKAKQAGVVNALLERLFQKCFSVAKQVRTETDIGASAVSVAYAAVNLAKHIYGNLEPTKVLLIGAGETIELVARHLYQNGCQHMTVANRTLSRAQNLADEFNAHVVPLSRVPESLIDADIVISSTASTLPIIGKGMVEQALKARRYKPMLLVDIAVPRDIEAQVADLDDAYLYSVDDLQEIVNQNMESRERAAAEAEEIIVVKANEFVTWRNALDSVDIIRTYRKNIEQIKLELVQKAQGQLKSGKDPEKVLNELANKLANRIIHSPTKAIKQAAEQDDIAKLAQIKKVLDLDN